MNHEDKEWEDKLMSYAQALPEKMPSALLEERTVRELRRRGLLQRKQVIPRMWLTGSVAASLLLFASGVVLGQYLAGRNTAKIVAAASSVESVESVRKTGDAYVQALEKLVNSTPQTQNRQDSTHAREVALTALHQAANEVARLAPNDPVVAQIIRGIEQERMDQTRKGRTPDRNIVWF